MSPVSFHLISLLPSTTPQAFLSALRALPAPDQPQWLGATHHWLHEPSLDTASLLGPDSEPAITKWDYLLVATTRDIPPSIRDLTARTWTVHAENPAVHPGIRAAMAEIESSTEPLAPPLPSGWSAADPSGLNTYVAPSGIGLTLNEPSRPLGAPKSSTAISAADYVRGFPPGDRVPVVMFNLLAYKPDGGRRTYQEGYVGGFIEKLGPAYGGRGIQLGYGIEGSDAAAAAGRQTQNQQGKQEWEDAAMVWYPSLWHFAKMIDDEAYVELDRKFKPVSLRDNPLMVTTEVKWQ
ncbi:hypothetical protein N3K66_005351 [Trichothecium roseum]|uniref:Uncharacterized protein n=1 Tax=Trichothecium roseum TaxID=47278 RepID=A0ACC0UZF1_9HYPO|nr:hypothetical protein N3K66_005351 [Trichothecium roseum]